MGSQFDLLQLETAGATEMVSTHPTVSLSSFFARNLTLDFGLIRRALLPNLSNAEDVCWMLSFRTVTTVHEQNFLHLIILPKLSFSLPFN